MFYIRLYLEKLKKFYYKLEGRTLLRIIVAVLAILGLFIYQVTRPAPDLLQSANIRSVRERGVLRVGVRDDVPGFAFGGSGLELELANRLSAKIFEDEAKTEFTLVTARTALPKMDRGHTDVTIALCRYVEKSSKYIYSIPYFTDAYAFMVKRGTVSNTEALRGKTVGVIQTSQAEAALTEYQSKTGITFKINKYASYEDIKAALNSNKIQAAGMEMAVCVKYLGEDDALLAEPFGTISYAICVPKAQPELAEIASAMIDEMKQSGELSRIIAHFGLTDYTDE